MRMPCLCRFAFFRACLSSPDLACHPRPELAAVTATAEGRGPVTPNLSGTYGLGWPLRRLPREGRGPVTSNLRGSGAGPGGP